MRLPDRFPLITLQPVAGAGNLWVSFILTGDLPLDQATLVHLLNGYGLAEILDSVSCEVGIAPESFDAAFVNDYPAGSLLLRTQEGCLQTPVGVVATAPATAVKSDATARGLLLKLLSLVTSDAETAEIEALIKRDPNLSYHLLKMVNSVAFARSGKITNFSQAIALLGRRQLQRWLQLLLYARPQGSTEASPLLPRAALRASLMEALAKRKNLPHDQQDNAFMVGMFSMLEALFGVPLAEIVAPLSLEDVVIQALTLGSGPLGVLLGVVKAGEAAPGEVLGAALAAAEISQDVWAAALVDAVRWTVKVSREA
jgi:hypothetical protein